MSQQGHVIDSLKDRKNVSFSSVRIPLKKIVRTNRSPEGPEGMATYKPDGDSAP
jgi:hypothetical protein